jgi:hypothetical protein
MSIMSCTACTRAIDTDYDVEASLADGEVWLCAGCREDTRVTLDALYAALRGLERQYQIKENTDAMFATSGRMDGLLRRIRYVQEEIDEREAEGGAAG